MSADGEGDAARIRFLDLLDHAPQPIVFWWRDDDAEDVTAALDRLLSLAKRHDLPLALAVVPKGATAALAKRLASEPRVAVLQHGWQHANHAAAGEKKIELGGARLVADILRELRGGRARLGSLFAAKALPVLVPPWNRIADDVRAATPKLGLVGLSTFGPAPAGARPWVNSHLDIFRWRPERRPLSRTEAYARLAAEVERRLAGSAEPIGILTHHLVHDAASWALLDELFAAVAKHPGARWPEISELFGF